MKLRNILAAIVAVTMTAACSVDEPVSKLAGIEYSNDYLTLAADNGASSSITVTADQDWTATTKATWLTISPASGAAGQQATITFTANEAAASDRTAEVNVTFGSKTKTIIVKQAAPAGVEAAPSTCKQIMEGPDVTYRVTGVVTKLANTHYGNWYINDGTVDGDGVYVYGTLDKKGGANSSSNSWDNINDANYANSWEFSVGDEITIEGPKTVYNGTVELVDVTIVKIEKSLIKIDAVTVGADTTSTLPADGGDITFSLDNKGNGIYVSVPEEAKSWLTIKSVDGNKVTFSATANNAGPRGASIVISTTDGSKEYKATAEVTQLGASGTIDVPFTVEEAMAFCKNLTAATAEKYYVKGIVTKIQNAYSAKYGNGTFWISSDGVGNGDKTKEFEVYNCYWFDNAMWTEANKQVSVGDEVVVYGQLTNYQGTCETNGKQCNIYSINGLKTDAEGLGSKDYPLTIKGACAFCSTLTVATDLNYYVAGTVCELTKYQYGEKYNTASFWLSDDGTTAGDKFEAYSIYYMNNPERSASVAWPTGGQLIEVGQKIVLYGQLTNYNGTCETNGKKAHIISINGKTE